MFTQQILFTFSTIFICRKFENVKFISGAHLKKKCRQNLKLYISLKKTLIYVPIAVKKVSIKIL